MTEQTKAVVDQWISENYTVEGPYKAIHHIDDNCVVEADGYLDLGELATRIENSLAQGFQAESAAGKDA